MPTSRWQQVNQLFYDALDHSPAEREDFLAQACNGDDSLRREVLSLLAADEKAALIEQPLGVVAADLLSDSRTGRPQSSLIGQQFGDYRVLGEIGRGGMGEVFLAQDRKMGRRVALKLLPERFTSDAERVHRFRQEARAASALNHPNIVTIFDIGRQNGRHFMATEFVEGQTLRAGINAGRLPLSESLDIAIQITGALSAAHQAGIIHRDIKPENLMLRPDGYVKVLDFGLAKLTERTSSDSDSEADTRGAGQGSHFETRTGMVLGTVNYMSPEQARGQKVDVRTDLFSLGVVLYEMLSGRNPFAGATRSHTLVAILDDDPAPLGDDIPEELQRLINRLLAKDREARFASANEAIAMLREVKDDLLSSARLPQAGTGDLSRGNTTDGGKAVSTNALSLFEQIPRRAYWGLAAVLIAVVAVAMAGRFDWPFRQNAARTLPFAKMRLSKLSLRSEFSAGIISPDGKHVLYQAGEPGRNASLRLRQLADGSDVELVPPNATIFIRNGFSPDSKFIYYSVQDEPGQLSGTLYRLPAGGNEPPRKIPAKTAFPITRLISPNGRLILLSRGNEVFVAGLNDGTERSLFRVSEQSKVEGMAWTRDGRQIIYKVRELQPGRGVVYSLVARPVWGGRERIILPPQPSEIRNLACLPGESGLLAVMPDEATGLYQLYHITYDGVIRRLTQDLNDYIDVSVTNDGKTVALYYQEQMSSLRLASLAEPSRDLSIGDWNGVINAFVCRRDGRIIYSQTDNNVAELWQLAPDGDHPVQLTTNGGINNYPMVSADERFIVFSSTRTGREEVYRVDINGGKASQLTTQGGSRPQPSPDGQWIVYENSTSQSQLLWKLPMEGGVPVQVADQEMRNPAISPDGKWIAAEQLDAITKKWRLAVMPFDGNAPVKLFDVAVSYGKLRWTPDSRALIFLEGHSAGFSQVIKLQPLDGGQPRILFSIGKDTLFWFDLSPDGKQIAYRAGRFITPTVLLTEIE
ncbi:MAG TPA: protein kinase [Blastocatellia bacterium]|nr:protein kinase [Blastocatellia bacterium]HMV87952.1 protein kinase [Blastocatellia bacterium]HMX27496.1 protein kinase [Blastocatellia bacterium]HMZ21912.1 protein kinase [Blastocatellia bacterium]HNG34626.1 protein kinase [Blastocatellia bacterium]